MAGDESQMDTRASLLIRLRQEPVDEGAWHEFVQRYGRLIFAWCQSWGLQPADADDVSQNVLLKLAHHLRSFVYDPGRRFRGFLRTTAHNACKDYLESKRRAVAASADTGIFAVLESLQARDDLAARLEEAFDLERLVPLCSTCKSAPSSRPRARCSRCSARRSSAWRGKYRYGRVPEPFRTRRIPDRPSARRW